MPNSLWPRGKHFETFSKRSEHLILEKSFCLGGAWMLSAGGLLSFFTPPREAGVSGVFALLLAGEQGSGFAVMATEVRNLAQRSATAAREIKTLIAESVDRVEGGAKPVSEAGDTMDDVTPQNAGLVDEAAAAAESLEEQARALVQSVGMFKLSEEGSALLRTVKQAPAQRLTRQAKSGQAKPKKHCSRPIALMPRKNGRRSDAPYP